MYVPPCAEGRVTCYNVRNSTQGASYSTPVYTIDLASTESIRTVVSFSSPDTQAQPEVSSANRRKSLVRTSLIPPWQPTYLGNQTTPENDVVETVDLCPVGFQHFQGRLGTLRQRRSQSRPSSYCSSQEDSSTSSSRKLRKSWTRTLTPPFLEFSDASHDIKIPGLDLPDRPTVNSIDFPENEPSSSEDSFTGSFRRSSTIASSASTYRSTNSSLSIRSIRSRLSCRITCDPTLDNEAAEAALDNVFRVTNLDDKSGVLVEDIIWLDQKALDRETKLHGAQSDESTSNPFVQLREIFRRVAKFVKTSTPRGTIAT